MNVKDLKKITIHRRESVHALMYREADNPHIGLS